MLLGNLSVKAHQLPRYVRYSHKYDYEKKKIVNVERMLGRTFSDYKKYVEEHSDDNIFQYDSVEGKIDDKKVKRMKNIETKSKKQTVKVIKIIF